MVKKAFDLLKDNPVIIGFYCITQLLLLLILFLLFPSNINQFMENGNINFAVYMMMMAKMLLACGLMLLLYILFIPGFSYMLSEAALKGKTSARSFLPGLKQFFVRTLLLLLLLIAASFAFGIIISMITIPFAMVQVMGGNGTQSLTLFITIFTLFVTILVIPFVLLCVPSIFIDDVNIFQGIKNGAKAGVKNYWKLVVMLLIIYLPIIFYQIICYDSISQGIIITPGYIGLIIFSGILSLFIFSLIFVIYRDYRMEQINNQSNNQINNQGTIL
ncbi:MAG TPA: hypothetical protein GXX75_02040 [Clostridiales bacterium]|nr:hypothetical protein [Clostridiales bacterium]